MNEQEMFLKSDQNIMNNIDLVEDPNTPSETLERLSYDESWRVRRGVADNPNTPIETLDRLSYDEAPGVRELVAHNRNTPQYIKDSIKFKEYLKYYTDP